jgi:hypothetical protein
MGMVVIEIFEVIGQPQVCLGDEKWNPGKLEGL